MKSRKQTTLAVLRDILGPTDGHEAMFAAMLDRSVSWVKKASSQAGRVNPKVAQLISSKTGISADWLLAENPFLPPVEADNRTPFTRESYAKWRSPGESYIGVDAISGVPECLAQIIGAFASAIQAGKSRLALDDLWKFSQAMRLRYGQPKSPDAAQDELVRIAEELRHLVARGGEAQPS
jgi:hypothetical protein